MSDQDKKPSGLPPEAEAEDDEKTIFAARPGVAAAPEEAPEDDADRTIIAPSIAQRSEPSAAEANSDETPAASDEDLDRTIIAPQAGVSPAPEAEAIPPEEAPDETADAPAEEGAAATGAAEAATVVAPTAARVQSSEPKPLSVLEPGVIINNMYRVEERLDQGGMGRVYRGVEIGTDESVAIKVILPEMAEDTKVADMFKREARVLRQLHHDAIVRYFAYVPPDQNLNLHALVMGFIEGTKLSDALKEKGALTRDQTIKLTLRLADGLERAHNIGVVHRDLSPDNVMLQDGDIGKAVLIDFGISRSSTVKDVTIGNEFAGKLKYVSPEQMGAFGGQAEAASDVYSLGLLMVAMLLGKPMDMGGNFVEAVQIRQGVPDLSEIPEEFRGLIHEMLQPDPAQRMSGMAAVIRALRDLDEGDTSLSKRMRGTYQPTQSPVNRTVPGLQAVPFTATSTMTQTGLGGTAPPSTAAPTEIPKERRRGLVATLFVAALAAAGGAAVFFAGDFLLTGNTPGGRSETTDPVAEGLLREPGTRATFLAEAVPPECALAVRRTQGPSAGLIEGFARDPAQLDGVGAAFGAAFGSAPEVVPRTVTDPQCSVVDLAHALQGTAGAGIEVALEANTLSRADPVQGVLSGSAGRQNWIALVDPSGMVFSLMRQFDDPIGDQRRFAFRLPSAAPGTYMVVATASADTLVRAGAMRDGTGAVDIMPLLMRELATDGQGAVDIAFLELTR
ncbi:serine/threonine-protein kinase [Tateyamaria sp. ANG-S1]|uniref:serine/threonine protein kinase n=1 Tax=Tateyamaria sp. ANG-S1 TaxID=1577905 RepID=UPI00068A7C82|nr:serine/threonine-protein kinase [Tateyamaria sp. ANG-S1]